MPTSGDSAASPKDDSFYSLLSKYGVASSVTGSADGVDYNIAEAPLYFVRSGHVALARGAFGNGGGYGWAWSSLAAPSDATNAWELRFGPNDDISSRYDPRHFGFPLRCLAS